MKNQEAAELIEKYLSGHCSPKEKALFESWYNDAIDKRTDLPDALDYSLLEKSLAASLPAGGHRQRVLWPRIAAVASIVIALSAGIYFYTTSRQPVPAVVVTNDIKPGRNTATLTLANGKIIQLSDGKTGVIVGDDLRYNDNTVVIAGANGEKGLRQTITTPRGGTYQITLSDGTKVWLNAASSLTYSADLNEQKLRSVKLEGEAYFEVAMDKQHPFIVSTGMQEVEVLGTHFNISGYKDEHQIETTLLEGSVRVSSSGEEGGREGVAKKLSEILRPGQQAILTADNRLNVKEADVEQALAWKNGLFMFDAESLESIMMKVSRWYNVDVSFENEQVRNQIFSGSVSRFANVSSLLSKLEKTGPIEFKIQGRKIVVLSKTKR